MAAPPETTPNRRGLRSRALVLDAAEKLMAEQGYEAVTIQAVVQEAGIPISSVYHYYGSKNGILLAVMERGAERFFDALPTVERAGRDPEPFLTDWLRQVVRTLERHSDFLTLVVVMATVPPAGDEAQAAQVVSRVRDLALDGLRDALAEAFDLKPRSAAADRLARFALATVDGAFVAQAADPAAKIGRTLQHLPAALVGMRAQL